MKDFSSFNMFYFVSLIANVIFFSHGATMTRFDSWMKGIGIVGAYCKGLWCLRVFSKFRMLILIITGIIYGTLPYLLILYSQIVIFAILLNTINNEEKIGDQGKNSIMKIYAALFPEWFSQGSTDVSEHLMFFIGINVIVNMGMFSLLI